jgi:transcriptional regulator of arginine metabolism
MNKNTLIDHHILDIIQNQSISEQKDLQKSLQDRGYSMPQATLSRRLKALKIVKIEGIYTTIKGNSTSLPSILNISCSDMGIMVLHTLPGHAQALAYFLDQTYVRSSFKAKRPILGTLAGDDTVLVILKSKKEIQEVLDIFYEQFPYLER